MICSGVVAGLPSHSPSSFPPLPILSFSISFSLLYSNVLLCADLLLFQCFCVFILFTLVSYESLVFGQFVDFRFVSVLVCGHFLSLCLLQWVCGVYEAVSDLEYWVLCKMVNSGALRMNEGTKFFAFMLYCNLPSSVQFTGMFTFFSGNTIKIVVASLF